MAHVNASALLLLAGVCCAAVSAPGSGGGARPSHNALVSEAKERLGQNSGRVSAARAALVKAEREAKTGSVLWRNCAMAAEKCALLAERKETEAQHARIAAESAAREAKVLKAQAQAREEEAARCREDLKTAQEQAGEAAELVSSLLTDEPSRSGPATWKP
eukprot:CAMPEP_0173446950 /NCGR_PEP_ID=MMETSP1357-20121228/37670_1 /TAXON_ID=77926 /ORGANISM="Hemiselmis rufescens, Strain PCC563" /LENGTH=160 /DNA_ID=CAMNT_0014413297 /DNA_START=291 /DNA_END=769 /DNA_ORIENTATION=-